MPEIIAQTEYSPEQITTLMSALRDQPEAFQTAILEHVTNNGITNPQEIAGYIHNQLMSAPVAQEMAQTQVDAPPANPLASALDGHEHVVAQFGAALNDYSEGQRSEPEPDNGRGFGR